jgi:nucleoside-diphosphate-sugar epimerase
MSRKIAEAAVQHKLIMDSNVKSVTPEQANEITAHGAVLLGTNARVVALRAREELGWEPAGHSLEEEIPLLVQEESKRLKKST